MNKNIMKGAAVAAAGLIVGMGGGFMLDQPAEVTKIVEVPVEKVTPGPVQIQEVEVVKFVDNGKMEELLQAIYDNDGDLEFVTEDLDEDELGLIVERVAVMGEYRMMAENEARKEALDLLDNELVNGTTLDEKEMRLKSTGLESELLSIDFEEEDATFEVELLVNQDGERYKALFSVEIVGGKARDVDLLSVELDE